MTPTYIGISMEEAVHALAKGDKFIGDKFIEYRFRAPNEEWKSCIGIIAWAPEILVESEFRRRIPERPLVEKIVAYEYKACQDDDRTSTEFALNLARRMVDEVATYASNHPRASLTDIKNHFLEPR